jgi:hypothetical protein
MIGAAPELEHYNDDEPRTNLLELARRATVISLLHVRDHGATASRRGEAAVAHACCI